jgi:predicted Rossmann fold nucleotide-binding protein DprA/Smf involved in DNA uptake
MKQLERQLKTIANSLATLSQKVEKLSQQASQTQPARRGSPGKKAAPKAGKAASSGAPTVLDTVYDVIKRSRKGVTVAQLKEKTNLNARQLSNALYKLSKKGKVYAKSRGLYVKK